MKYRFTPIGLVLILLIQTAVIWTLLTKVAEMENRITGLEIYIDQTLRPTVAIRMLIAKTNPALSDNQRATITAAIMTSARRHGLDPFLLASVARRESGFWPNAVGRTNDYGLYQIQPATFIEVHPSGHIYDIWDNTEAAARYLRYLLERFDWDLRLALAAYNCGPSRHPERIIAISGRYADVVLSWWQSSKEVYMI